MPLTFNYIKHVNWRVFNISTVLISTIKEWLQSSVVSTGHLFKIQTTEDVPTSYATVSMRTY